MAVVTVFIKFFRAGKIGKWWRHTLCYQLFRKIGQFARMIWENIGFLWKVILVMLVLAFLEGIGVLMFFNSDIALLLWLLEKLVLYPLVLWYCVQLNQLKNGTEKLQAVSRAIRSVQSV